MAGEFIRKWFGKSPALAPPVQEALAELDQLATSRPTLTGPIRLLVELLPELHADPIREVSLSLTEAQAAAKLTASVHLLRGEAFTPDDSAFRRRWEQVCTAVQKQRTDSAARQLADALRTGQLDGQELRRAALNGRPEEVFARAEMLGLDAALTGTVLRLTLFGELTPLSAALAPLRKGIPWERGYCPVCGSWPLLGEFRGLEQTRFLRCELCAAAWEFPRLVCPYCSTRDHRLLGYLHVEGEESGPRAATCDRCHGYVKMVATLTELPPLRLLVADLVTTHLDLIAAERGYTRPPAFQSFSGEP